MTLSAPTQLLELPDCNIYKCINLFNSYKNIYLGTHYYMQNLRICLLIFIHYYIVCFLIMKACITDHAFITDQSPIV